MLSQIFKSIRVVVLMALLGLALPAHAAAAHGEGVVCRHLLAREPRHRSRPGPRARSPPSQCNGCAHERQRGWRERRRARQRDEQRRAGLAAAALVGLAAAAGLIRLLVFVGGRGGVGSGPAGPRRPRASRGARSRGCHGCAPFPSTSTFSSSSSSSAFSAATAATAAQPPSRAATALIGHLPNAQRLRIGEVLVARPAAPAAGLGLRRGRSRGRGARRQAALAAALRPRCSLRGCVRLKGVAQLAEPRGEQDRRAHV